MIATSWSTDLPSFDSRWITQGKENTDCNQDNPIVFHFPQGKIYPDAKNVKINHEKLYALQEMTLYLTHVDLYHHPFGVEMLE
ncbi:MAG: hypothetical protein JW908_02860 [Anaerolineales bacterium]|nr:hypothetical protein [Anaerolineales bacterium]